MRSICTLVAFFIAAGCKPEKPANTVAGDKARARVAAAQLETSGLGGGESQEQEGNGLSEEQRAIPVAQIGEVTITLGDVERQLASQPAFVRARYRAFDKKVEFLNNLVQFELLATEAQRKGYDKDPEVVLAVKKAMIEKYLKTDMQKIVTASSISDDEVAQYYANNKDVFNKPALVRASHLQVKTREKAAEILAELKASIEADKPRARVIFSDFVRRLSEDDRNNFRNGDLGFFSADGFPEESEAGTIKLAEPLVQAAFSLDAVNDISDIVQTDKGFHLVQVTQQRPAVNRSLQEAKRQIVQVLLRRKKDAAQDNFIASLRSKAKVEVFEDKLKLLNVDTISTLRTDGKVVSPPNVPPTPGGPGKSAPEAGADKAPAIKAPAVRKLALPPIQKMANPVRALRLPKNARPKRGPAQAIESQSKRAQAGGQD